MSEKLINIVLDLETLGTAEDAAIIQIGCVIPEFDRKYVNKTLPFFEATVRYEDALGSEFSKESSTMEWWEQQSQQAKSHVFSGQDTYIDVLDDFVNWISDIKSDGAEVAVWGNGSDFDNRLLTYTLSAFGHKNVWNFRNNRDLRTLKALFPVDLEWPSHFIKHTALADACYEAEIIEAIVAKYKVAL